MQKLVLVLLAVGSLTGCARRLNDPQEVLGQSYVHRYGVPVAADNWTAQGESGKVVSTLKNGVVVSRSYNQGVLEGDTTYTYPHSDLIASVETYSQGQLLKEMSYYRNGTSSEQTTYVSSDTRLVEGWYDNGSPQKSETYQNELLLKGDYYTLDNQIENHVENSSGTRTRRDRFGNLISIDTINDGLVSLSTTYHSNGTVKSKIPYANGKIDGQLRTFMPAGEPATVETWSQGEQTGITTLFENGEKIAEVPYLNGVKNGVELRYRNGDTVVGRVTWSQDVQHGPNVTTIGDITTTDYFYQGNPVTKAVFEKMTNASLSQIQ